MNRYRSAGNLPSVNGIGALPVLANDNSLQLEQQTFWYPFTVQFTNENALSVLISPEVANITLTATFTVGSITLAAPATIELASGENPRFENYTPSNALGVSIVAKLRYAFLQGHAESAAPVVQRGEPDQRCWLRDVHPERTHQPQHTRHEPQRRYF